MQYLFQLLHRCRSYNNHFLLKINISDLTKVENINMNPTTRQFSECFLSVLSVTLGLNKK